MELRYENGGGLTGPGAADIAPPAGDTWFLRLTKKGNTYTGAISANGTDWVQAPGSVTVALNNPALGLMAFGPAQAAPIDVDFEYFHVGDADTEAPVTTATSDPAAGADGWISAPAKITLAATDAGSGVERTEYSLDGGEWVTYTAPFDAPVGEHTLRYRSVDKAGVVEEAKTAALKVRVVSSSDGTVGGNVPATLSLTLGAPASFGAFTPGVTKDYTASTTATVISSAGDATLSVSEPGRLTNGTFSLAVAAGGLALEGELDGAGDQRPGHDRVQAAHRGERGAAHRQLLEVADVHAVDHDTVT